MSQSTKCPKCRRMVRPEYIYYPYCQDHRSNSFSYKDTEAGASHISHRDMPSSFVHHRISLSRMISVETNLDEETSLQVVSTMEQFSNGLDLTIPEVARASSFNTDDFRSRLEMNGIDGRRLSTLKLTGLNRFSFSDGAEQKAEGYTRQVVVIDKGLNSETVVDPSMADLAPVWDQDRPVEFELISGETPYGDVPWVGKVDDYTGSGYIWWDKVEE